MSRRTGRELEQMPHHVYAHLDADVNVIYVGMTSDPESRPTDTHKRPWIKTESHSVEVSPAMSFDAATFMERLMIRTLHPKHNTQARSPRPEVRDWRIDRVCESEGVTRATARWALRYMPEDPDEFEALLARRREGLTDGWVSRALLTAP